jgi:iron complex outermembrane receptor protein
MHARQPSTLALAIGLVLGTSAVAGPGVAQAQEAAAPAAALEEVVVTARKREESLSEVSAALDVVGADDLATQQLNDVEDLQLLVPTLNVGETVGAMKVTVRGLGNVSNTRGEDSMVAFHVDGAVVSRPESQGMSLFDLERVEVLRGPQGTLYGRNATGGAINAVTAKPTDAFEGYVTLTAGNYDLLKVDAALSGPLGERTRGRLAVTSTDRAGFGENITTANDIDDDHRWAARGHLEFDIGEDMTLLFTGEYGKQDDASGLFTYLTPLYVIEPPAAPPTQAPKGVGGFSSPGSRDGAGNIDPQMERETVSATATYTWNISDTLTLRDIFSYRRLDFYLAQDLDLSTVIPPPNTTATVAIPMDADQMSNELQLVYSTERLDLITGLYWFTEDLEGVTYVGEQPRKDVWFWRAGESTAESWAGFFNANFRFNDALAARIGGRYNNDNREIDSSQWVLGTITVPPKSPLNPGYDDRTDTEYTGEYGVDWHVTDAAMLYFTFSQGYQQGAGVIMQVTNPIIDPTTVDNYEVGFKYATPDRRFAFELIGYDMKAKDLQRTQAVPLPNGTFATIINNIDEMTIRGAELTVDWLPTDALRVYLGGAYTDAEFDDYVTDDPLRFGTELVQLKGNTPQLTPTWKGNVGADYGFALGNGADLTVGANLYYTEDVYFDEFNRAPMEEDSYALLNATAVYRPADANWRVTLWGKNLTDEQELADASFSANGRVTSKKWIDPLTFGVSINLDF